MGLSQALYCTGSIGWFIGGSAGGLVDCFGAMLHRISQKHNVSSYSKHNYM